eukprot:155960-Prymnesium_polylepis.3
MALAPRAARSAAALLASAHSTLGVAVTEGALSAAASAPAGLERAAGPRLVAGIARASWAALLAFVAS